MSKPRPGPRAPVLAMGNDPGGRVGEVVSADGVPVRYAAYGDGLPAIVFVHGWSCDRRYWHGQVGHFAARFTVVTVDLAGHGESGTGRRSWTMPAFGEDVAAVVTGLDLPEVVLVGHSMGGDVVVEAARRLRPRVRGLVWVDVYRSLDESGSDAATEEETAAFMAPFRVDFGVATRASSGASPAPTPTRIWSIGSPRTWPPHHLTSPWTRCGMPSAPELHLPTSNHSPATASRRQCFRPPVIS